MWRKCISIVLLLTCMSGIYGCVSIPEEHKGAAAGAGIGAATGATAGALLGSKGAKTEMAVVGGLLGALAGGLVGHYAYDQKRSQEETADRYNYSPSQRGTLVRIEEASVFPKIVRSGDDVDIRMVYALLSDTGQEINVTETREIRYNGKLFGKPEVQVKREGGTYVSTIPITLPHDAQKGTYKVLVKVRADNVSDSKETSFSVK